MSLRRVGGGGGAKSLRIIFNAVKMGIIAVKLGLEIKKIKVLIN